jgi:hypothetical protein
VINKIKKRQSKNYPNIHLIKKPLAAKEIPHLLHIVKKNPRGTMDKKLKNRKIKLH